MSKTVSILMIKALVDDPADPEKSSAVRMRLYDCINMTRCQWAGFEWCGCGVEWSVSFILPG